MKFKHTVSDWRFLTFLSLLVLAPLSKYPSIAIPLFNFPSFRLGLYQLLAVVFVLLCSKQIYNVGIGFFAKHHRIVLVALVLFSVLAMTSIAWSLYPARSALLAISIVLLVAVLIAAWWFTATELTDKRKTIVLQALLYASVIYGGIAILQLIMFTLTNETLGILCSGCTAEVFGFPRVNGFAAEPQFFANALLPFVFAALYAGIKRPSRLAWAALIASVGTIGLTFSRGAYVALAVSLIAVGISLYTLKLAALKKIVAIFSVIAGGIIGSLFLLVISATIRYNDTPHIFYETIDSIAEHLTNGLIDLPESAQPVQQPLPEAPTQENADAPFVSPGLIEESGQERLGAAELALQAWRYSPLTLLFGVGVGNLGPFVVANIDANAPDNLTVYMYYILLLSELGIVGLASILILFGVAIYSLCIRKTVQSVIVSGLLIAFAVQFMFFGSYINVVYIWVWLGIALGITSISKTQKTRVNKV